MKLSPKFRWVILITGLTVSVALASWAGDTTDSSKNMVASGEGSSQQSALHKNIVTATHLDLSRMRRISVDADTQAEPERDVFAAKSWYVAQPLPKILPVVKLESPPPAPPVPPQLPYAYMGRFEDMEGKSVIFLSNGDRIHEVKVGDTIEGAYKIESVEGNTMTLIYLPLSAKQTLALGG